MFHNLQYRFDCFRVIRLKRMRAVETALEIFWPEPKDGDELEEGRQLRL
jgi:hypothetical protein